MLRGVGAGRGGRGTFARRVPYVCRPDGVLSKCRWHIYAVLVYRWRSVGGVTSVVLAYCVAADWRRVNPGGENKDGVYFRLFLLLPPRLGRQ